MNKMFFLTAMFQNKFGKAMKYYDEKGWHWMLTSDKPKLFENIGNAKAEASELSKDILSEITIREIYVYSGLWEHKIDQTDNFPFTNIFDDRLEGKYRIVLSETKQFEHAREIIGLYRISREDDTWIYGIEKLEEDSPYEADELIYTSLQKLLEAKALMQIFEYEKSEISKVEGVIVFVKRLLKSTEGLNVLDDDEILDSPEKFILSALEKLQLAKKVMLKKNAVKTDISKIDGVLVFVQKLVK